MTTKQITAANADEQIRQLYQTAFPEEEQIPWTDLMRLVEQMPLDFTAYYDGEEFIGFFIVYPRPSYNWFWYFAHLPIQVRIQSRGNAAMHSISAMVSGTPMFTDPSMATPLLL